MPTNNVAIVLYVHKWCRVLAICFPMRFQITGRRARLIILLIWIVALTTTIPWPVYFHLVSAFPSNPEIRLCLEEWPSERDKDLYFILANVVFCYLLPLFLILLCYVMIWIRVSRRSIPTESKDAHINRLQQRSKVLLLKSFASIIFQRSRILLGNLLSSELCNASLF